MKCSLTRPQNLLDFCSLPTMGSCDTWSHDFVSCSSSSDWKFGPRDPFCFPVLISGSGSGSVISRMGTVARKSSASPNLPSFNLSFNIYYLHEKKKKKRYKLLTFVAFSPLLLLS